MMIHTMVTYFDNSRVEHNPKEIIKFIGNKTITRKTITKNYQVFVDGNQMIQCVDTLVLDLLILY